MIWFTADTHLEHLTILKHCNRPFGSIKAHDDYLINQINKYVLKKDVLYHLGDFVWKNSRMGHFRQRINCNEIHVIRGNHDTSSLRKHVSTFDWMCIKKFNGIKFILCHYPLETWSGQIHLHGHCHGRLLSKPNRLDVGIDNAFIRFGEYKPFSLDEIKESYNVG